MEADRSRADELVSAVVALAMDRGALSDELHFAATSPAERHQLDHGRANVLRALELDPQLAILEVGAGYGALTRYLGERSASVHAIEPDPARAAVAAIRTGELDGVRVAATLNDLPSRAGYDLAVIAERFATPVLLRSIRARLRAGAGVVIQASGVIGRRSAEAALHSAGLPVTRVLTCAPGYPVARVVRSDELVVEQPRLAASLAEPGEPGFALLAGAGAAALWPAGRLASYFNTAERAAVWCTRADVVRTAAGAEVRRAPLLPDPRPAAGISIRRCSDTVHDAPTMLTVLLEEPWRAVELLTGWRELLDAEAQRVGPALWDLVPHNVLVDGPTLRPIDLEWEHAFAGVTEVTERGLLVLAHYLAVAGWQGAGEGSTMRELAGWLGVLLGHHPSYVDEAVDREVAFATVGSCGTARGTAEVRAAIRAVWEDRLEQRVNGYLSRELGASEHNGDEVAE